MIRLDVAQGSPEWVAARLGIPTASEFDKIITPKTGKLSASFEGYAYQLLAERMLGRPIDDASSGFIQRGSVMEQEAVDWYQFNQGIDTERVGFVLRDDRRVGCSPDRLVGTDGLLEIKCPSAAVHVAYLLGGESIGAKYRAQVQGQLWLTGRSWCDTLSYHPEIPCALVRQERDEEFIRALASAVDQFLNFMYTASTKLVDLGLLPDDEAPALRVA